jgi:hypothetical protein
LGLWAPQCGEWHVRGLSARSTRELCLSSLDFGRAARACGSHTGGHSTQARLQRRRSGARVLGLERRYLRLRVPWDSGGANQRPSARSARALCLSLRPRTSNATTKPKFSRVLEGGGGLGLAAAAATATAVAARFCDAAGGGGLGRGSRRCRRRRQKRVLGLGGTVARVMWWWRHRRG